MASVLSYSPFSQDDELLYSWVGWAVKLNAFGSPRSAAERLFGDKNALPIPDLPSRLQTLHSRLHHMSPTKSATDLILNTTLFPYHSPFLTPSRAQALQRAMLSDSGSGIKTFTGRVANRFGARHELKFCPTCLAEDYSKSLRPYWRRRHQLPGVWCCLQHHCMLIPLSSPNSLTRREFLLPDKFTYSQESPSQCTDQQMWFAKISTRLLDSSIDPVSPLIRRTAYNVAIASMGLTGSRGAPDFEALARSIRLHYNDFVEFEHRSRLLSSARSPLAWLHTAIYRPECSLHPICHLLLIGFLFETFDEYLHQLEGLGVTTTRLDPQNTERSSSRSTIGYRELLLDSTLSCREIAKRTQLSTNSVILARGELGIHLQSRPKLLRGEKLKLILCDLQIGGDLNSIAKLHEVSLISLYRQLRMHPEVNVKREKIIYERELVQRRKQWEAALKSSGDRGISGAREFQGATYAWLRRHDHEWLWRHKPKCRKVIVNRVNWSNRDSELLNSLMRLAENQLLLPNRPRMSQTYWLNLLGRENMIRRNSGKLPFTSSLLNNLHETTEDYCARRLLRTIQDFKSQGVPLVSWKIQQAAGIKFLSPQLRLVIADATNSKISKDYFN